MHTDTHQNRGKKKACERTMRPSPDQVQENKEPMCEVLYTLSNPTTLHLYHHHLILKVFTQANTVHATRTRTLVVNKVSNHGNKNSEEAADETDLSCAATNQDAHNNDSTTFSDKLIINHNYQKWRRE